MNPSFFQQIEGILHAERIDAYRQDGAAPALTMGRYTLNMALSEALYPSLQFAEVALRNAIHAAMTVRCNTDAWYDTKAARLTIWQQDRVTEAKANLAKHKKTLTPGRMVAELNFGFWTGFFNKSHGQTGIGHFLTSSIYPHAPLAEQDLNKLGAHWGRIRDLRNRVFHHERILHWKDLDTRHQTILKIIGWISPDLQDLANALDRFASLRKAGLKPWLAKLGRHWPATAPVANNAFGNLEPVDDSFDATNGAETPFGHRWGGDVFSLSLSHIEAIQHGQTLALDVMSEYVVFLKSEEGGGR